MAQQRLGGRVVRSTLLDAQYPGGSFDVVTMFEVLEHLPAIKAHLQEAMRLLKPGGWLCVSVPNFESLERYVFGRWWVGLDAPRHLIQFSPESLRSLLSGAGLAIRELRSVNADRIQKSKSRITYAQESLRYLLRALKLYPQRVPPTPETLYQNQAVPLAPQKRVFRIVEKIFLSPFVRLAGVLDRENTLWVVGQKP
jgi:SAM-dependent methyltransferase